MLPFVLPRMWSQHIAEMRDLSFVKRPRSVFGAFQGPGLNPGNQTWKLNIWSSFRKVSGQV